jgi:hypothetical protein
MRSIITSLIALAGALGAVSPAPAQARPEQEHSTLPGVGSPSAPYGIGRTTPGFQLDRSGVGPHFAFGQPALRAVPVRPGQRDDGKPVLSCPMPVGTAEADSAGMPRVGVDARRPPAPMPVAPPDCVNPLDPR